MLFPKLVAVMFRDQFHLQCLQVCSDSTQFLRSYPHMPCHQNLSILFIAIWTTIIKRFSVGILPLNHYICSGINPQESLGTKAYQSMAKKYNSSLIVVSLCFLLHVGLGPKILMFKRKSEKKVEPIILGNLNQQHPHGDNCLEGNKAQKSFSPLRYVLIRDIGGSPLIEILKISHVVLI